MSAPARDPLPDALRALALVGVLVVNAIGYGVAPSGPLLGLPEPAGSVMALATIGGVAALLQGKAYPMLALLFGAGLTLALRDRSPAALRRARQRCARLLVLGLLHGTLLYFGDILTLYALVTPFVLPHVHEPWHRLRPRLRRALAWTIASLLALAAIGLASWVSGPLPGLSTLPEPVAPMAAATTWRAFLRDNASAFWMLMMLGVPFGFPVVRLCMLGGVAVVRLRLLSHRRWRRQRAWLAGQGLLLALLANLGLALPVVVAAQEGRAPGAWLDVASTPIGIALSACLLAAFAAGLARPARAVWRARLAPLGRRTLSLYVGHGAWCLLVYTDVGLGWRPGTVGVVATSLVLWLAAGLAAHRWPGTWPLEAWMGRRT